MEHEARSMERGRLTALVMGLLGLAASAFAELPKPAWVEGGIESFAEYSTALKAGREDGSATIDELFMAARAHRFAGDIGEATAFAQAVLDREPEDAVIKAMAHRQLSHFFTSRMEYAKAQEHAQTGFQLLGEPADEPKKAVELERYELHWAMVDATYEQWQLRELREQHLLAAHAIAKRHFEADEADPDPDWQRAFAVTYARQFWINPLYHNYDEDVVLKAIPRCFELFESLPKEMRGSLLNRNTLAGLHSLAAAVLKANGDDESEIAGGNVLYHYEQRIKIHDESLRKFPALEESRFHRALARTSLELYRDRSLPDDGGQTKEYEEIRDDLLSLVKHDPLNRNWHHKVGRVNSLLLWEAYEGDDYEAALGYSDGSIEAREWICDPKNGADVVEDWLGYLGGAWENRGRMYDGIDDSKAAMKAYQKSRDTLRRAALITASNPKIARRYKDVAFRIGGHQGAVEATVENYQQLGTDLEKMARTYGTEQSDHLYGDVAAAYENLGIILRSLKANPVRLAEVYGNRVVALRRACDASPTSTSYPTILWRAYHDQAVHLALSADAEKADGMKPLERAVAVLEEALAQVEKRGDEDGGRVAETFGRLHRQFRSVLQGHAPPTQEQLQ